MSDVTLFVKQRTHTIYECTQALRLSQLFAQLKLPCNILLLYTQTAANNSLAVKSGKSLNEGGGGCRRGSHECCETVAPAVDVTSSVLYSACLLIPLKLQRNDNGKDKHQLSKLKEPGARKKDSTAYPQKQKEEARKGPINNGSNLSVRSAH